VCSPCLGDHYWQQQVMRVVHEGAYWTQLLLATRTGCFVKKYNLTSFMATILIAGSTTHVIDPKSGKVVKHIENWDVDPSKVVSQVRSHVRTTFVSNDCK